MKDTFIWGIIAATIAFLAMFIDKILGLYLDSKTQKARKKTLARQEEMRKQDEIAQQSKETFNELAEEFKRKYSKYLNRPEQ